MLAFHRTSDEVNAAIGLLFSTGCLFLFLAFLLSQDQPIVFVTEKLPQRLFDFAANFCRPSIRYELLRHTQPLLDEGEEEGGAAPPRNNEEGDGEGDPESLLTPVDSDVMAESTAAAAYDTLPTAADAAEYALVLQGVVKEFSTSESGTASAKRVAVRDLSLALKYGEVFGLLGPNGAGKSTTISIIAGTLQCTRGCVIVAGHDISHGASKQIHGLVGMCAQDDVVWGEMTVEEHLRFQVGK